MERMVARHMRYTASRCHLQNSPISVFSTFVHVSSTVQPERSSHFIQVLVYRKTRGWTLLDLVLDVGSFRRLSTAFSAGWQFQFKRRVQAERCTEFDIGETRVFARAFGFISPEFALHDPFPLVFQLGLTILLWLLLISIIEIVTLGTGGPRW